MGLLGCFLMVVFYDMRSRKWFVLLSAPKSSGSLQVLSGSACVCVGGGGGGG